MATTMTTESKPSGLGPKDGDGDGRPQTGGPLLPGADRYKGDINYARRVFESGVLTLKQIGEELEIPLAKLTYRATRERWQRDPAVAAAVALTLAERAADQRREIVMITAAQQSAVLVEHRRDIKRARELVNMLFDECAALTTNLADFEEIGELLHAPNSRGVDRLNDAYRRVISLPERSASIKSLIDAMKTLIALERQAFAIEGPLQDPETPAANDGNAGVLKGLDKLMSKFDEVLAMQVPGAAQEGQGTREGQKPAASVIINV